MGTLNAPHGGNLVNRYLTGSDLQTAKDDTLHLKSWSLSHRQLCDVDLILNGAFSPLVGFLNQSDYQRCLSDMRLESGHLWPMPVTLDVSKAFADTLALGEKVVLRDQEGVAIALMTVESRWEADKRTEAESVFGSSDEAHPGVAYLMRDAAPVYLGGALAGLEPPHQYDFLQHRHTPAALRQMFQERGWTRIVAFQTRNPMHRAHMELTKRAAQLTEASLLIQPVVGMTKPGDIDYYSRVRCYEHVLRQYPEQTAMLSLLNLAMRMGGPREALWHAIIRKNYGASHFIIGRDHAGPGKNSQGHDFYHPYAAQELVEHHAEELGIKVVPFQEMVYVRNRGEYVPADKVKPEDEVLTISGTEFRRRLVNDLEIPEWFSFPEVVEELKRTYPPKARQGFCLFFTGLSGAGKSTVANAVMAKLLEQGGRTVTLLDGDQVRQHLSSELGFSKEHRDLNVSRIGFVAKEIARAGGIAICAPIAPYKSVRNAIRRSFDGSGGFLEVYVSTPLATCEERDRKGLYAKARAGLIKGFTGIDDPYEEPENPELALNTAEMSKDEAAQRVLLKLQSMGYL